MKNIIFLMITFIFSTFAHANPYIGVSYQEMDAVTSYDGFDKKEQLTGLTIGGLNLNSERVSHYMTPSWEISIDFNENAFNKLHEERYTQLTMVNLAVNVPVQKDSYLKFGVGSLKSNIVLSNGDTDEDERVFNIRVGGGYRIFNQVILGAHYDTATNSPSIQLGYLFK